MNIKNMIIDQCECGSKEFIVRESYSYKASLDEESTLDCGKENGGIDSIACSECGKSYSENCFKYINF